MAVTEVVVEMIRLVEMEEVAEMEVIKLAETTRMAEMEEVAEIQEVVEIQEVAEMKEAVITLIQSSPLILQLLSPPFTLTFTTVQLRHQERFIKRIRLLTTSRLRWQKFRPFSRQTTSFSEILICSNS